MIQQNKVRKYILYAIGEIILVVIGILIALQINTWNQEYISNKDEKAILANLNQEFQQNRIALVKAKEYNKKAYKAGLKIMKLIGESKNVLRKINIDSLIYSAVEFQAFRPSENAFFNLMQSGRLQQLKNESLKDFLYKWSRNLKSAEDNYNDYDNKIENELIPYLTNNYLLKDVDFYGQLQWKTKSKLKVDKYLIFQDFKFENLIDDTLYRLFTYNKNIHELESIINSIIKESSAND